MANRSGGWKTFHPVNTFGEKSWRDDLPPIKNKKNHSAVLGHLKHRSPTQAQIDELRKHGCWINPKNLLDARQLLERVRLEVEIVSPPSPATATQIEFLRTWGCNWMPPNFKAAENAIEQIKQSKRYVKAMQGREVERSA